VQGINNQDPLGGHGTGRSKLTESALIFTKHLKSRIVLRAGPRGSGVVMINQIIQKSKDNLASLGLPA